MAAVWMVRAGKGGFLIEDFQKHNCIAANWSVYQDIASLDSRDDLRSLINTANPDARPGQIVSWTGQLANFLFEMKEENNVVTYDSSSREYITGTIAGDYEYAPDLIENHEHIRKVIWGDRIKRDDLSVPARNTLGTISTIFKINETVWAEMQNLLQGNRHVALPEEEKDELEEIRDDVLGRSHEFIKDRVQKLNWQEMQELIAGILRSIGYKTLVSPPGSDRGKDIIASPDGLGLEHPRIKVEVKHHSRGHMGAPAVRSFLGGLRQNDRGLYVSTGGFSREAHYEAERAPVPLTLIDLDALVSLLIQNYENLDTDTRALVPLVKVYWPAS